LGGEKGLPVFFNSPFAFHSQFPTVKRLLQVKLRTFWRKHDKDLIVAHELFGECVMCPIGSKAAANLCRDGVDFNLQWCFFLETLHRLIYQCMKG
jgi:hypothetical protein